MTEPITPLITVIGTDGEMCGPDGCEIPAAAAPTAPSAS